MKKQNWIEVFSVNKDGFYGHLYQPANDEFAGKAIVVLGGGGVPYQCTLDEAEAFAKIGIVALAVGYFGVPDTPKTIVRVPIEYVQKATDCLHNKGIKTVIVAGISKGAELALIAGSFLPQINGVIAFSPSSRVNMAVGGGISWVNVSSWTFKGKELPYAYAYTSVWQALGYSLWARELTFLPAYQKAYCSATDESRIPVENIQGPILLAAAVNDSLWPSAQACAEMMARLDEHHFPWPHQQLIYPYACHLLLPFETNYTGLFRIGRRYPEECRKTIADLQKEVLNWLKELD